MPQRVGVLDTKFENLSSIPGTHKVVEEENNPTNCPLTHIPIQ